MFDLLGSISGYILWFFFDLLGNYGLAITFFAIIMNVLMFPLSIKRQKSMAKNSKLVLKQQALKKQYNKDPKKYNEEIAKLYQKEGSNPMSGCLPTLLLPLILWGGIYAAINKPLQNTLHIKKEKISLAIEIINSIPEFNNKITKNYEQLQIVKFFPEIKENLDMFSEKEMENITEFSLGFDLLGLKLLNKPNESREFTSFLWLIPLLCFLSSAFSMYISQKFSDVSQQNLESCAAKYTPYIMFLFTGYLAYTMPAAVGLYWIINAILNTIQSIILNKYFNIYVLNAKDEYKRMKYLKLHKS
ncbi:MAG: YidC/Oxa1 family membrane protein insertase [Candidatus Paraimprobicoccus trichonymphae]|uniref:YidC/Oxa1 family membrane protein insertase n=1 Tax=Candidatus Paraimprobicoccus trichonymphae TaxID=3033793 RepID=A0AA48KZP2_9FIRM|nr:MAG: YidC/Oxa1 family membrane protein insertase [Candidatus Paraimprobicoccus trichonymphae]